MTSNRTMFADKHRMPPKSACERYGMTWGCREECPVFQAGECEIQEENEKLFNELEGE